MNARWKRNVLSFFLKCICVRAVLQVKVTWLFLLPELLILAIHTYPS